MPKIYANPFRSDGNEVFLPFSFLEKHFEARPESMYLICFSLLNHYKNLYLYFAQMKGEMVGDQEFEISESYGKVFTPRWLQQLYIDF